MKYTSLFLDLDNTLLDFNKAEYYAAKKLFEKYGLPCDDEAIKTYSEINHSFWKRFESGEIKKDEIYENRFKAFCERFGKTADTAQMSKDYFINLSEGAYTVEGTFDVLDYLKAKDYKLYATTNGMSLTQYKRIEKSGLGPYFDKVFVSEDAGHQKPEKEYFEYVLKNIPEKDKSKILIVGDSQSSDILGGINIGIDTCWLNPEKIVGKYIPNYEIRNLFELKELL
jgi:2-haloacid dehalogenase